MKFGVEEAAQRPVVEEESLNHVALEGTGPTIVVVLRLTLTVLRVVQPCTTGLKQMVVDLDSITTYRVTQIRFTGLLQVDNIN